MFKCALKYQFVVTLVLSHADLGDNSGGTVY